MNVRTIAARLRRYWRRAVLVGIGVMSLTAWTELAAAQVTFTAGGVSGNEGETVAVPIIVTLGSSNLAFFALTFSVAQGNGIPVTDEMSYEPAPGIPAPDLQTAVAPQAKLAIGYAGITFQPALVGRVQVGTLMVPIPFGAAGGSYQVQLARVSAGDSAGKKLGVVAQPGTITVSGQSGSAPGGNPPVGNQGAPPPPPAVEAPGTGPGSQAQAPGAAPTAARAPGANPFNAAAAPPTLPMGGGAVPSPQAPEGGQGAPTPAMVAQAPAGQAPVGQAPAGQSPAGKTPAAPTPAPSAAVTSGEAEAVGTSTAPVQTPTAGKTATVAPATTATKKAAAAAVKTPESESSCALAPAPARGTAAWRLIVPVALLLVRRRR